MARRLKSPKSTIYYRVSELNDILIRERAKGKKIAFTNGCFDIIHYGHIKLLEDTKSRGDILVVGLNSDDSVRRLKGDNRPLQGEMERAEILASLRMVDYVVIFNELTPLKLIKSIKPDVLVKGSDYKDKEVVGRQEVERGGGEVYLFPVKKAYSTTTLLRRMQEIV